jgi:transposase
MAKYKYTNDSQGLFITFNLKDQILPNTFEWTLKYLLRKMDLSVFDNYYRNDELGAAAYPPIILLTIILFCYSRGIITSRKIERACVENMLVKALAEDFEPDHATIADFISRNSEEVKKLFTEVLLQCDELDLICGEMFAIDGRKMSSNASKEWSGKIEELKKKRDKLKQHISKMLIRHQDLDKSESAKKILEPFSETMGDDKERREKSIERMEKKLRKLNEFLNKAKPKKGVSGEEVKTNVTDPESAYMKGAHSAYIQGFNAIGIADSANQIIVSAEVIGSGPESGCFPKMLDSLEENMKKVTGEENPLQEALLEGDTGFFSEDNLHEAEKRNIEVLIPDPQFRKRDPVFADRKGTEVTKSKFKKEDFEYDEKNDTYKCPGGKTLSHMGHVKLRNNEGEKYQAKKGSCVNCSLIEKCISKRTSTNPVRTLYIEEKKHEENLSDKMRKKIDDPAYRELYSRRMQIIEPTFSNITYCKGMHRFTMRGEKKNGIQWKLYVVVHNIGKCMKALAEVWGV